MQAAVSDREQLQPMLAPSHCWVGAGVCWPALARAQGPLVLPLAAPQVGDRG